jgi:hypothetical protein
MNRKQRLCVEFLEYRLVPSTFYLHQGDSLQNAIDLAQPGDTILLDPGATFVGPITLVAKANPNNQWISMATNNFPVPYGTRVSPSDAPAMAEIVAPGLGNIAAPSPVGVSPSVAPPTAEFGGTAIQTQPGANDYYLRGLDILPASVDAMIYTLVAVGDGGSNQSSASQEPSNIVIDQCYIHGLDGQDIKRGVELNDGGTDGQNGVSNSYISDFKSVGQDTQAIAGWNGTGPYYITNNYLEAAGENVMFGGAWSYIQQVPSDISITDNTFSKPLSWDPNDPSYAGTPWVVKNLLELKTAQNVVVQNNTLENVWVGGQNGDAILLTPRGDQSGGAWVTVSNVTIVHNTITNATQGILLLGSDDSSASGLATDITIEDNLFGDVASGNPEWGEAGGPPHVFSLESGLAGGPVNIVIDHNTILQNNGDLLLLGGAVTGLQFTNNIASQGEYGVIGSKGLGEAALDALAAGYIFTNNVIVGGANVGYPDGNAEPTSWDTVGFVDYQADDTGDYLLASNSPYYGSGADIATFTTALF